MIGTIQPVLLQLLNQEGCDVRECRTHKKLKLNSVAFSPQANYTDRATAACRRS
jgi:hypothetical protein